MRRPPRHRSTLFATIATCAVATALFLSPPTVQQAVRSGVLDGIAPSQAWVVAHYESARQLILNRFSRSTPSTPLFASTNGAEGDLRIVALEQAGRRLRLENARLREELSLAEKYGVSPVPATGRSSPAALTVVPATVINQQTQSVAAEQLLNSGRSHGLTEADVVLDESAARLDQGSEAGIEPELDVLIGRCVVGRIASVGRWASALEPITDPRYRGLAQIIRPSDQGGSFGAEGILVGQGTELLQLTDVPTTQSVRVGDEVYTSDRDRRFPIPLYYGRVVRVEEAGRNWEIAVRPAVRVSDLKTVAVLKVARSAGKTLAE
ncbi:MAG TPA: rod shape-determining protein MreC [Planctomycetaceae bacterium]|jgi:cell shape-determining protein MreC|nr:rod shape-determining protein MreC [Planctomycetaceae bacterium]